MTSTLHHYKKVISIVATLSTTQSRFHFASLLARAARYRNYIRHRRSRLLLSHTHHPFTQ
jgi:hypothetical protein